MPVFSQDCPSFLLSLPTCVMYYIGCYISQRIQYRITAMVSWCVLRCAPSYLCDLCCPVSVLTARRVLRFAARGELLIPRTHLATVQRNAFAVVGQSAWNDLPVELRPLLRASPSKFYISLM